MQTENSSTELLKVSNESQPDFVAKNVAVVSYHESKHPRRYSLNRYTL